MAITPTNIQTNHRGVAFRFIGDGATTTATVPHARFVKPSMPVSNVYVVTGATTFSNRSHRGGLRAAEDGTAVTATASITGGNLTVTTNPAVTNGTVAYCVAVFDASAD